MRIFNKKLLQRGDTITEVLLSMAILAIVGVSAYATSTRSYHASLNSQQRDQGISYAQQQIELLKNNDNAGTISSFTPPSWTAGTTFCINPSSPGSPTALSGSATACTTTDPSYTYVDKYDANSKTFSVTVSWTSADGRSQQTTIYYKPGGSYVTCTSGSCVPPTQTPITNPPPYDIRVYATTSTSVPYGGSVSVYWTTNNIQPGTCKAAGDWNGDLAGGAASDNRASSSPFTVTNLTHRPTSTIDLICNDLTGVPQHAQTNVQVTVAAPPAVTFTFTASPTSIYNGNSSSLSWSTTNATSCTGTNFSTGASSPTSGGPVSVSPSSTTTYTLTCKRIDNITTDSANATVTVTSAPAVTFNYFTASPASMYAGTSTTLSWSTTNATSCTGNNGLNTSNATTGSFALTPGGSTVYTLTCTRLDNVNTDSTYVSVTVNPLPYALLYQCANNVPAGCTFGGSFTVNQGVGQFYTPFPGYLLFNLTYYNGNFPVTLWDSRGVCENFYVNSSGMNNAISSNPGRSGSGSYCNVVDKVYRYPINYISGLYTDCIYGYPYGTNQSHTYGTWNGHACQ